VPTAFLETSLRSPTAASVADILAPVYLSTDFIAETHAALDGLGSRAVLRARFLSDVRLTAGTVVTPATLASLRSCVAFSVAVSPSGRVAADLAIEMLSETTLAAASLQVGLPPASLRVGSRLGASFAPYLPPIAEPAWNELRGTINLVRNASVEQTDVGLLDWDGVNGATLALDDTVSWHGPRSVEVTYPNTGSDARVTVRSEHGLGIAGELNTAMVGSLWALGEITFVQARITATYSDASTDTATGDLFDLAAVDDWVRVVTPSLTLDPAKTLDYLTLDLMHPTPDAVTVIHVDGAQIEQDRGESATPFAQGDMGAAFAWLGPAGLSMSLRETMAVTT
jgi:hypothetical protein